MCQANSSVSSEFNIVNVDDKALGTFTKMPTDAIGKIEQQLQNRTNQKDQQNFQQNTQSILVNTSTLVNCSSKVVGMNNNSNPGNKHHDQSDNTNAKGSEDPRNDLSTSCNISAIKVNVHELLSENEALREKLKHVTNDRDRLLCEVSNLHLELDILELKRMSKEK